MNQTHDPMYLGLTRPPMMMGVTQSFLVINAMVSMTAFLATSSFLPALCDRARHARIRLPRLLKGCAHLRHLAHAGAVSQMPQSSVLAREQLRPAPMIALWKHIGPRFQLALHEAPASDYIPYACHLDAKETILTKNGQLLRNARPALDGLPFETASAEELAREKSSAIRCSKRSPDNLRALVSCRAPAPPGLSRRRFQTGFADYLDRAWREKTAAVLLSPYLHFDPATRTQRKNWSLANFVHRLSQRRDAEGQRAYLSAGVQELSAVSRQFENAFVAYGASAYSRRYETPIGGVFSEPLRFLGHSLINLEDSSRKGCRRRRSDRSLCAKRPDLRP